ncbi:MAG: hypothetical protein V1775_02260 [Bacteroidota bacterium]
MNTNNYPDREELNAIRFWIVRENASMEENLEGLMDYIEPLWTQHGSFLKKSNMYFLSTGGWSGNEDIISALEQNHMFWALFACSWERGGHFVFATLEVWINKLMGNK